MEQLNLVESHMALKVLKALKIAFIVVDRRLAVIESSGCAPTFANLNDVAGFRGLVPQVEDCFVRGVSHDFEATLPTAPELEHPERQYVRIARLDEQQVVVALQPLSRATTSATEQLREYEFVVRNIRQGIWRLDQEGRILFANPYLAAWLESTPDRMIGRNLREFLPDGKLDHERESGIDRFESEFVTESGLHRRCIVVSSPMVDAQGRETGRVELITDITAEHAVQSRLVLEVQRMAQLASLDPLTSLLNRRAFELTLQDLASEADERPFGLVVLDLDGLKGINDDMGHEAGDLAISAFAERLGWAVRDSDRVARLGGDEFAVLVPGVSSAVLAEVASRLEEATTFELDYHGTPIPLRASLGWSHSADGTKDMLSRADRSMYRNKRARRA